LASRADIAIRQENGGGASAFVSRFERGSSGPSVAIKDVIDIAGLPTRAGSKALEDAPPAAANAAIVDNLLAAPCRIVGKTALHELAYGVTGLNEAYGAPRNPRYPGLIPGGSSSGSAVAVAAGECDFSIGTDTGGSIRVPAACCGVIGLKPTFGRLSREGCLPAQSSLDCVGPLARDARGIELAMRCLDPTFNSLPDPSDVRLAWLAVECDLSARDAVQAFAQSIAPTIPSVFSETFSDAHQAGLTIIAAESYNAFSSLLDSGLVGSDVADRLARAKQITPAQLDEAEQVRAAFRAEIDALLEAHEVLALPTLPVLPPKLTEAGDLLEMVGITTLCRPFNLSGHPAIAIPAGEIRGRPVSLQLVTAKGRDELLVAMAGLLEVRHERREDG